MITHQCEQNTEGWAKLRSGLPTASAASKLVTSTGQASESLNGYALELAYNLYAGEPLDSWEGNQHTKRGHELEPVAAMSYEMMHDCELEQVGFCTDDKGLYGCSVDRFRDENGIVEIKCQQAKGHTESILYHDKHKNPPTTYYPQTQMQLYVTGREYCDLMFYHPNLPKLIIRVLPSKPMFEMLECQIEEVIKERDRIVEILRNT